MQLQRVAFQGALGKGAVFRNSAGRPCTVQRWRTDNTYGGGGRRATRLLRNAPPTLTDPTTVMVTDAMTGVTMDPTKDYIILLPGAVGNTLQTTPHQPKMSQNNGLVISGGRNVTMIGGAVRRDIDMQAGKYITSSSNYRAARNRAFFIKDWTGRFHMEGVYIGGQHLYEAFNISAVSSTASLVAQNICVDAVCLKTPDWTGASSHDGGDAAIQNWDGPAAGMFVDGFSVKATTYQAFFNQPTQFGSAAPSKSEFYNVDIDWARPEITGWPDSGRREPWPWDTSVFGKGNKMLHFASTGSVADAGYLDFQNFYMNNWPEFGGGTPLWSVNPDPSDASPAKPVLNGADLTWPGLTNVTGKITVGLPPGGPFVPRETVGVGYVSPGYIGQSVHVPDPPTAATVVTVGTTTYNSQALSFGAVAKATRYSTQYRRNADTAWSNGPTGTSTSVVVNNLDPDTSYTYRVAGINDDGAGPWSDTVSSTTGSAPVVIVDGGEVRTGPWTSVFFYDGTSPFNILNPQNGFLLDSTNERIKVINSGTAGSYYGIIPFATAGPSQANSTKISSLTTTTTRNSIMLLLNLDNTTDAVPLNFYEGSFGYNSTTKIASFRIRKVVNGVQSWTTSIDVDYSARTGGIEGLIMRLEHRIETDNSHTIELSYDGVVIKTITADPVPLTGKYTAIRHYNSGGSSATANANATVDDIRIYGKPAA